MGSILDRDTCKAPHPNGLAQDERKVCPVIWGRRIPPPSRRLAIVRSLTYSSQFLLCQAFPIPPRADLIQRPQFVAGGSPGSIKSSLIIFRLEQSRILCSLTGLRA